MKAIKKKWFRLSGIATAIAITASMLLSISLPTTEMRLEVGGFLSFNANVGVSVAAELPGQEVIEKRTANSKTTYLGGNSYAWGGTMSVGEISSRTGMSANKVKEICKSLARNGYVKFLKV